MRHKQEFVNSMVIAAMVFAIIACGRASPTPQTEDMPADVTPTSYPSPTATYEPTTTPVPVILDISRVLQKDLTEVDDYLGKPIVAFQLEVTGNIAATPMGESHGYAFGEYLVYVDFNKNGIAKLITIQGVDHLFFKIGDWEQLMMYYNLPVDLSGL